MKKEKGFTLIELLAVIIILAVIALISIPLVLNIIEKTRKSAFEDTAYGIMESAKLYYIENIIDNKELGDKVFSYEEEEKELKYSGTRPKGGMIIVKSNGKIEMSIHNGKWCAVKSEEDSKVKIIDYNEETCKISGIVEPSKPTLKSPEEIMTAEAVGENGAIRIDTSGNKRYAGSAPNNYVCFGTDEETCSGKQLWRIIGVIDGNLKLISTEYYSTSIAYDGTSSNYSNDWTKPASLNTELQNNVYENTEWINSNVQKEWLRNDRWKLGGISNNIAGSVYTLTLFEEAEKNGGYTTSNYVGLMSVTDFGYGSSDSSCTLNSNLKKQNNECFNRNWLKSTIDSEWTISPVNNTWSHMWDLYANNYNYVTNHQACLAAYFGARPVVILDINVKIKSGKGIIDEPYLLSK